MTHPDHPDRLDRRSFIRLTARVAATSGLAGFLAAPAYAAETGEPLFKISLAQWSLNRRFFKREEPHLDALDFAKVTRGFGIGAVEYVNQFFKDKARDEKYLGELKRRAEGEGVKSLLIMVDGEGRLGDPDAAGRAKAVENHHKWADAAKFLGCHSIRVNAASDAKLSYDEQLSLAADGLSSLTGYGASLGLNVIVENHGGLSSNGAWLAGVMRRVDHPRCGTLPDFGNFAIDRGKGIWYDRYQGVKELMPFAKAVSAKAHDFDDKRPWVTTGHGKETDFLKMMRIVLDAGCGELVGVESEGRMDQAAGVEKTRDLLIRVREKLAPEYQEKAK